MPALLRDNKDIERKVLDLLLRVRMTMNAICEKPHNLTVLDMSSDSPRFSMYRASLPIHLIDDVL